MKKLIQQHKEDAYSWAVALQESLRQGIEVVPPDWKTSTQIAKELNRSLSYTQHILPIMVEQGLAETTLFRIATKKGSRPVPHYRLKRK